MIASLDAEVVAGRMSLYHYSVLHICDQILHISIPDHHLPSAPKCIASIVENCEMVN